MAKTTRTTVSELLCFSLPVKDSWPHHSATGVHGHENVECLMHPHDVTKPKVHGHKWCNNRREGRVRQAHHQNEQMVGKLEKRGGSNLKRNPFVI